jgi:hypothetical protein
MSGSSGFLIFGVSSLTEAAISVKIKIGHPEQAGLVPALSKDLSLFVHNPHG